MSTVPHKREVLAALRLPESRFAGAGPLEPIRRLGVGIGAVDEMLDGGLPRGHLSEIVGAPSSGRTALVHALLAAATRRGEVSAVVDLPDALDPSALARVGADLARVLWVRPPTVRVGFQCAELILNAGGFGLVVLDLGAPRRPRFVPHVWPRLARAARRSGAVLAVLAGRRVAGSSASVGLECVRQRACWGAHLFEGIAARVVVVRSRFGGEGRARVVHHAG